MIIIFIFVIFMWFVMVSNDVPLLCSFVGVRQFPVEWRAVLGDLSYSFTF